MDLISKGFTHPRTLLRGVLLAIAPVTCWVALGHTAAAHPGHVHTHFEGEPALANAAEARSTARAASSTARAPSAERILYILGEFADAPLTIDDNLFSSRAQTINATAEDFWNFNSYGRITEFDADFTPVLSLATNSVDLPRNGNGTVNLFSIRDTLVAGATQAGFDANSYDQVVLLFPSIQDFGAGAFGTPGTVWLPGQNPFDGGLIHELGHAFGLGHASTLEAGTQSLTSQQPNGLFGQHREGRDGLFMLGSDERVRLSGPGVDGRRAPINFAQRYQAGFVGEELLERVDTAETVRIHAFDRGDISGDAALGRSLAAVFEFGGQEWWLTFAPGLAELWSEFNGEGFAQGAILHQVEGAITRSVDFTPGSQGGFGTREEDFVDTRDGALVVGESFTFPDDGPTLSTLAVGVSPDGVPYLDVRISFDGPFVPLLQGDVNLDGLVDESDFEVLASNLFTEAAFTLSQEEAFRLGDLNGDARINHDDFVEFRRAFDLANGPGAFASFLAAPEPSTLALGLGALFGAGSWAGRGMRPR